MNAPVTAPRGTRAGLRNAALLLFMITTLSACVRSEDAVDEDGTNPPVADTPTTGAPADPALPAPADPAPADPPPADAPPMDPSPTDPPPADPPTLEPPADDPMNPTPPDQPPPGDPMPDPVDPNPPMDAPPLTDLQVFEQTLYPVLREPTNFCAGCHGGVQIPLFAAENVMDAYNALVTQQKVDLVTPENSRVYLRAAVDRHNCGGADSCDRIAGAVLTAIQSWASQAAPPAPAPVTAAVSGTVSFADAEEIAMPRVEGNSIATFRFEEGTGTTTHDSGGSGMVLNLEGMTWEPDGGIRNVSGKAEASEADSRRLFDAIDASRAYTVEAWVIPDNTAQDGPARIVSYSVNTGSRNFTLGQNAIYYQLRNRSGNTGGNGTPALEADNQMVATELTHLVATFDEASGRKLYVNGQLLQEENTADTLDWQDNQIFVLGNEVTNDRLWQGVMKLVAVHSAALTAAEVQQNFDAGLGNLTSLRFDISEAVGEPAMVEMIAATLDGHSYLFAEPRYLGGADNVVFKNLRIAINGSVPIAAQAFRRMDVVAEASGWQLSPLGAVIPMAMGPDQDQFQLVFETLGNLSGAPDTVAPPAPPPPLPDTDDQNYGVRSFSQLNDTFAVLTGIEATGNRMQTLYEELRGALPATNDLESYSQSQQVAVQRLANGYCAEVVGNNGRCNTLFGDCEVANGGQQNVAERLFDRFVGTELTNQPMRTAFTDELVSMLNDLNCGTGCNGETARIALAAACSATLSSGAVTIH